MSLIKQSDVKNHLSGRHRTEIHVARPESQPDATGFPHEESAGADPKVNDSVPTAGVPETAPIVPSTSAKV